MKRVAVAVLLLLVAAGCTTPAADDPTAQPSAGGSSAAPASPPASTGPKAGGDAGEPGDGASDLAKQAEDIARGGNQPGSNIAPRDGEVLGGDVSWPQCPKGMGIPQKQGKGLPMPEPTAEFVVLGLTNGPAFTPNPCLATQVQWARDSKVLVAAYSVSSFPDKATLQREGANGPYDASTRAGKLKNVGYQQARYNVGTMGQAGLNSPIVWIDVEPVPGFEWSANLAENAAVIEGVARGYTDQGYRIGVYSTPNLYERVVGTYSMGGIPEWRAAGETSKAEATARCGADWAIQGGPAVMGQWVQGQRDLDVTCPGIARDLGSWFHRFT